MLFRSVFRRLYEHLQNQAASDPEVVGLRLYVEHENQRAQATYSRLGMSSSGYQVLESMFTAPGEST